MSSYQVIARKWRPGVFEEVVGQTHITRTLRNAIASGRIAHAYLFSGPRGVGKTTAARILAKCLNCLNGPTVTPCGACEPCKGITTGSSVDVFEIDGASNNSVDNIREISESVRYVPSLGKYKIYIIDEVHMLSTAAFNALLKTLEEPPPHAIFIFATTEVHKIPATILSRCQRFDFKRIPFRDIQAHLKKIVEKEGIPFEDQALFLLAREADGSLRDSQSLLEQSLAFAGGDLKAVHVAEALGLMDRSILFEISEAIVGKDPRACLNIVEKVYEFGYDLKRATSDLLEHLRDLAVLKVTGDSSLLDLPDSELERLAEIGSRAGAERLQMLFSIISKGYEDVSRSAHPRYALEMALLKAAHFDELEPLGELVARLEALASKAGVGSRGQQAPAGPASSERIPAERPTPVPWKRDAQPIAAPQKAAPAPVPVPTPAVTSCVQVEAAQEAEPANPGPDNGLLEFVGNRNKELAELLKGAAIEAEGEAVNITVAARLGAKLTVMRAPLDAVLRDFYGRPVTARINGNGTAAPGAPRQKDADPVLKDALRILGGRIIEDRRRSNV
jgi:DNA polymerase-3 subunit gamma/tau